MAYELQDLGGPVRFAIHDRDAKFTSGFDAVLESEGVEVIRTPYRSPLANSHCESSIGSARREFFDFMIVVGEGHLRVLLDLWLDHYNRSRPHGLVFGILEIVGFVIGSASNPYPMQVLPSGGTAARMASTPMPTGVWVGFGLEVFSILFLVAFAVVGWAIVRAADEHGVLATSALAAAIANVAVVLASFGVGFAINAGAGHGLEAQGLLVLSDLQTGTYVLGWPVLGLFLGCLSIGALRTRSLPSWLAWVGIALGVAEIASCLSPIDGPGQLVQLVPLVWIPAAGIALAIRHPAGAPRPAGMMVRA